VAVGGGLGLLMAAEGLADAALLGQTAFTPDRLTYAHRASTQRQKELRIS